MTDQLWTKTIMRDKELTNVWKTLTSYKNLLSLFPQRVRDFNHVNTWHVSSDNYECSSSIFERRFYRFVLRFHLASLFLSFLFSWFDLRYNGKNERKLNKNGIGFVPCTGQNTNSRIRLLRFHISIFHGSLTMVQVKLWVSELVSQ